MAKFRAILSGWAVCTLIAASSAALAADSSRGLISHSAAARSGLTRSWFTQLEVDPSRGKIAGIVLHGDTLFMASEQGVITALDAETGRTRWSTAIGKATYPTMGPAASDDYVAALNGSRLYVLERATGMPAWDRQVGGGAGAGPAIGADYVFVPLINGRIEGYNLKKPKGPAWIYWSNGRAMVAPIVTTQTVSWPTDRGHFCVGRADNPGIRFRVETKDAITAPAAYRRPYLYCASRDGYVYAVNEMTGNQRWRYSAGDPISESPVPIGDRVYACAGSGGLHAINAETGRAAWWAPYITRVLAVTPKRLYGADRAGNLVVLDVETGARAGQIQVPGMTLAYTNVSNDRIYVGTDTGLIQCLHEVDLDKPHVYVQPDPAEEEPGAKPKKPKAAASDEGEVAADDDAAGEDAMAGDDAAAGEAAAEDGEMPADDMPAEDGDGAGEDGKEPGDEDPFGNK